MHAVIPLWHETINLSFVGFLTPIFSSAFFISSTDLKVLSAFKTSGKGRFLEVGIHPY